MQFTHLLRKVHYEHGFRHQVDLSFGGMAHLAWGSNWKMSEGELLAHLNRLEVLGFCWRLGLGAVMWVDSSAASS